MASYAKEASKRIGITQFSKGVRAVRQLLRKQDLVVTYNKKPIAVATQVDEISWEETLRAVRHAKAMMALERIRARTQ